MGQAAVLLEGKNTVGVKILKQSKISKDDGVKANSVCW